MDLWDKILDYAGKCTVAGLSLGAVYLLLWEKVVPGTTHKRAIAERDARIAAVTAERDRALVERDNWKLEMLNLRVLLDKLIRAIDPHAPPMPDAERLPEERSPAERLPARRKRQ